MCQITKRCCAETFTRCREWLDSRPGLWAVRLTDPPDQVWVNRVAHQWLESPGRWVWPQYAPTGADMDDMNAADARLVAGVSQSEILLSRARNLKPRICHWHTLERCSCGSAFILILFRASG